MNKKRLSYKRASNISFTVRSARWRISTRKLVFGIVIGAILAAGIAMLAPAQPEPMHHGWDGCGMTGGIPVEPYQPSACIGHIFERTS
jgi:hypothetical protein